jgi:hypothetical protein
MVMLSSRWRRFLAMLTMLTALGRFMDGIFGHSPHDDETADGEGADATLYAKLPSQAPPPPAAVFEPMQHDPWPWFENELAAA